MPVSKRMPIMPPTSRPHQPPPPELQQRPPAPRGRRLKTTASTFAADLTPAPLSTIVADLTPTSLARGRPHKLMRATLPSPSRGQQLQPARPSRSTPPCTTVSKTYLSVCSAGPTHSDEGDLPNARRLLRLAVSASTWAGRNRTARMLVDSAARHSPLQAIENLLAQRIPSVLPSTVARDLGHAKWLATRLWPNENLPPFLSDLQAGLRKMDAVRERKKALPLSKRKLRELLTALNRAPRTQALALLAFRTGSRIGDLADLKSPNLSVSSRGLLVRFVRTKTNMEAASRPDHITLVSAPEPSLVQLANLPPNKPLFKSSNRKRLTAELRALDPGNEPAKWQLLAPHSRLRPRYTLHSLKRGAAALAWKAAADGTLTVAAVLHLLKHKSVETALSYCPAPLWAAEALGASKATEVTALNGSVGQMPRGNPRQPPPQRRPADHFTSTETDSLTTTGPTTTSSRSTTSTS